ncbi:ABC transporter permease [Microbacterium kribbense]|uniref:ABC transporter permease n=1 Tax=Microbacterium kribbense TaxID=433645 RepID=A0ABP7GYK0_9MICO
MSITADVSTSPQRSRRSRASAPLSSGVEATLSVVGVVGLIALWQIVSMTGAVSARILSSPWDVATAGGRLLMTGEFWMATWATVWITVLGIIVVMLIAVPLAIAIHRSQFVDESTWFVIEFLKPIPGVALIPLTLLLWGPGDGVKLFLIVFGALWPILTQLVYGLRETSGIALDMTRVYRFSPAQRLRWLTIPSMMPFTLTGLRISVTIALIITVVTEYIAGIPGLGTMLAVAQLNGVTDQAYALLLFAGLLGLAFSGAVASLSRPLLFWHASQRERRGA